MKGSTCLKALWGLAVFVTLVPVKAEVDVLRGVDGAEQQFIQAMTSAPEVMNSLLADDFVYLTTAGAVIGKRALIEHLRSGRTVVIAAQREATHQIRRPDHVVTSGVLTVRVLHEGGERSIRSRYLHVWTRSTRDAPWQLLARQAITLPEQAR